MLVQLIQLTARQVITASHMMIPASRGLFRAQQEPSKVKKAARRTEIVKFASRAGFALVLV